jgi:glyoxylate/hydroxypyruvate reductase
MPNLYVHTQLKPSEQQYLQDRLPTDYKVYFGNLLPNASERKGAFLASEVVFGNVPPAWLSESTCLRWLQLHSAGYNEYEGLDWQSPSLQRITLTNLRSFFGQPVAETALAGILALYRKIYELSILQSQKHWVGGALRPNMHLLHRKQVLILGKGDIGQTLAKLLGAFECEVHLTGRTVENNHLEYLLQKADVVVSTLPETPQTIHYLTAHRLSLLKPTAVFVNVGRGTTIDEAALYQCLLGRTIAGAVLDVTLNEPLPPEHPFWSMPQVLLTQHTGGGYELENQDKIDYLLQNLQQYSIRQPLTGIISF